MAITNVAAHEAANTLYQAALVEEFTVGPEDVCRALTTSFPTQAKSGSINVLASIPQVEAWIGDKVFRNMRAYSQTTEIGKFQASIELPRRDFEGDELGVVNQAIRQFLANNRAWFTQQVTSRLLGNTWTSYDGVTLLNNSHPHTDGTGDNLLTTQLSFDSYETARQALHSFEDEYGTPVGGPADVLMVGRVNERTALEVTGSLRPVEVAADGSVGAASGVAAVNLENYVGDAAVVVNQFIPDDSWFLIRTGGAGRGLPFGYFDAGSRSVLLTDMDDEGRFMRDVFRASVEIDGAFFAFDWHRIVGAINPS